ncbi:WD repeat-containing 74 [Brachionus plicatilis]|uniref:WD repeat-containing 74 n=1 Tax=Brachionus plicatilis TaxID=10195 RepID=A0A3M7SN11_BRAPC|nr:WD repeat-containing 74 [Brachionus plicatilis]
MTLFDYNIFVGTDNGLLKGINSKTRSFNNLNSMENLTKDKEILQMSWFDQKTQQDIFFCTKDKHLVKFNTLKNIQDPFIQFGSFDCGLGDLKGMEIIEDKILTCVDKGLMKLWSVNEENLSKNLVSEIKCGSDIFAIKKNPFNINLIATGGIENDLKVWNLDKTEAIFKAKNVSDNWIQLREPVWVSAIDFLDENRVVIGTGHHQVRVYDLKTGIRKPIYNLTYGENPITAISVLPDFSNRVIVGNTRGEMEMIDLRSAVSKNDQCKTIKKYKGFQGTIKSIQIENCPQYKLNGSDLCVAACGLDRFLRLHHVESSSLFCKVYLKSRLNCLLFSKHEPIKPATKQSGEMEDDQVSNIWALMIFGVTWRQFD